MTNVKCKQENKDLYLYLYLYLYICIVCIGMVIRINDQCTLWTQTLEFRIHGIANTHPSIKQTCLPFIYKYKYKYPSIHQTTYLPFPSVALNVYLRWLILSYLYFHKLSMYFKYNILSMYFKYNILGPRIGLPYLIHEDMIITYMGCVCI